MNNLDRIGLTVKANVTLNTESNIESVKKGQATFYHPVRKQSQITGDGYLKSKNEMSTDYYDVEKSYRREF